MERGEGHGVDSRRGVGNGLDRGRVDVVVDGVDMPALDVLALQVLLLLLLKALPRWNASLVVSSNTVLTVERRPAITITKWAMALGHQQGTRPWRTPGTIQ